MKNQKQTKEKTGIKVVIGPVEKPLEELTEKEANTVISEVESDLNRLKKLMVAEGAAISLEVGVIGYGIDGLRYYIEKSADIFCNTYPNNICIPPNYNTDIAMLGFGTLVVTLLTIIMAGLLVRTFKEYKEGREVIDVLKTQKAYK